MEKHIVALSGGKDSTATAILLKETEPRDYLYIFTPTGKEMDELFEHMKKLAVVLGSPILPVMSNIGFTSRIEQYNTLPSFHARWCTRQLKIEPMKAFLLQSAPCVHYVGLRADEEERVGIYGEIAGVTQRYPLREHGMGVVQVREFLDARGIEIPQRTDCYWCFFQTIAEWYLLWKRKPDQYAESEAWEEKTGHTWRSPSRDTWPVGLKELREEFERGVRKIPNLEKHLQLRLSASDRGEMCRVCSL